MTVTREILGESAAIKEMMKLIHRVAATKTNVLIIGESGTGKELVARAIHELGPLKSKPFVPVNCGAIPETLIESEMFGHRKGSFTGAVAEKAGLFEVASGGTLFLDEVGELPLSMQAKMLRALQERTIRKVGGTEDIRVDVRIIAATNRDLEEAVAKGTFREDLYYRLNVILIRTPSLKERRGDIKLLAEKFLTRCAARYGKSVSGFEPEVIAAFEHHTWPGNVRELENVIERAVTLENHERVTMGCLPPALLAAGKALSDSVAARGRASATVAQAGAGPPGSPGAAAGGGGGKELRVPAPDFGAGAVNLDQVLGDIERMYLTAALEHAGGVKKRAAELLGVTFRSIRYRLKKLGVDTSDGDSEGDEGE